jgi:hypothetical protein
MKPGDLLQRIGRYADLLLIIIIALAATDAVGLDAPSYLRFIPVVPLVLFVPGYLLVGALFPTAHLSGLERVLISVGSSIALVILTGLALALLGLPLVPFLWTVALASIAVIGALIVGLRRARAGYRRPGIQFSISRLDALFLVVAGVSLVGILAWDAVTTAQMEGPPPAQLWLLPADGGAPVAQLGVRAGSPGGNYMVRLTSSGVPLYEYDISLAASEIWVMTVPFTAEQRALPVVARLYEEPTDTEIRFVVLQPLGG